jgi:ABC-type branched-subunit amino acid transport system ATPase component
MGVIRGLRDERGLTIVVVEHDMDLVMGISDRVAVLDHGRKIADGAPREIVSDAAVVEAYLGSEDDP